MRRAFSFVLALTLFPALALAAQESVEASMVVTGTITVNPDGSVRGYALRDEDKLPSGVRSIIAKTVPHWEFAPVMEDGRAVTAETGMSLRIVADAITHGRGLVHVAGAQFGCSAYQTHLLVPDACPAGSSVSYKDRTVAPLYPAVAFSNGMGGEVFLTLEIDRSGRVSRAAVRRVNLYARTAYPDLFRKVFADSALRAARRWQFTVPTVGRAAGKDHWVVEVPVNYRMAQDSAHELAEGRWNAYLPGPVHTIPWDGRDAAGSKDGADAIVGSAPFTSDRRFVLKTPLDADRDGS